MCPIPTPPNDDRHDDAKHDLLAIKVLTSSRVSAMKSDGKWINNAHYLSHCRWDISLVSNPPIGMSFGPWNVSQSLPVKGATTNAFLFGFTEILLSKSVPNLEALIPLNRAKSYDPNNPTFTFIPILEGEIRNLPVLCLHTFAG